MFDAMDLLTRLARHSTPLHRVYKYELYARDVTTLGLPQGAELLTVAFQGDSLCLWALVNPEAPIAQRDFRVAGTVAEMRARMSFAFKEGDWAVSTGAHEQTVVHGPFPSIDAAFTWAREHAGAERFFSDFAFDGF